MRNLCYGGSFNPIHNGHLRCSAAVAAAMGITRLVLIPAATSPHKPRHANMATAEDRMAMCRLAVAGDALYEVDDLELRRAGSSYTIETVRELRRRWGSSKIDWLIGADQVAALPKWHEPQPLLQEVNFLIMARPGWSFDWQTLPAEFQSLQQHVIEAPLIDISATDIRARVRAGEPVDHLTPPAVAEYIASRGLYRA